MIPRGRGPNFQQDDWDTCDHGIPLEDECDACEREDDLFDADELGLDPEQDDQRGARDA